MATKITHNPLLDYSDLDRETRYILHEVAAHIDGGTLTEDQIATKEVQLTREALVGFLRGVLDNPEYLGTAMSERLKKLLPSA